MSRRKRVVKREILPDPIYNSKLVAKFINCLMKKGKKSLAESIFYESLNIVQKKNRRGLFRPFQKSGGECKANGRS